ncbi:MAG: TPD domain-containing protein [Candidatus Altiarchaeota archaeon]|nr:TPD domain-containing protein [Candidatus Altiarchaeota archaeon]
MNNNIDRTSNEIVQEIFRNPASHNSIVQKQSADFGSGEFWIDSKFSYGNLAKFTNDYKAQFKNNMGFFEKGVVVYWRGYSRNAFWAAQQIGIKLMSGWEVFKELEKKGLKESFLRNAAGKLAMFHKFA